MTTYSDYTIENALSNALNYAKKHFDQGSLLKIEDRDDNGNILKDGVDENSWETVYSIISLYSDDKNDDGTWENKISNELIKVYPDFF